MWDLPDAVVLGAGFSRAVSEHMPLTNELGGQVLDDLSLRDDRRIPAFGDTGLTFEDALSLLAEDQPQHSERDNRERGAVFAALLAGIVRALTQAENLAVTSGCPSWLVDLIGVLHYRSLTVITFNYDTLIEVAVNSLQLRTSLGVGVINPGDVLSGSPPLPVGIDYGREHHSSFRLLKLHGSADWWCVPQDVSGATLNREPFHSTFGHFFRLADGDRRTLLPGREPFIVPPAAAKSTYYRNPLIRELWHTAAEELNAAKRVAFLGYSFQPADLVMAGMVQAALRDRSVNVDIVNLDPDPPLARALALGATPALVSTFGGTDAILNYSRVLTERLAFGNVTTMQLLLPSIAPTSRLTVTWVGPFEPGKTGVRPVTAALPPDSDGLIELTLEGSPPTAVTAATSRPSVSPLGQNVLTISDLGPLLAGARGLFVTRSDGSRAPIVSFSVTPGVSPSVGLIPSGKERAEQA